MGEGLRGEVGETLILVSGRVARYPTATGHGSRLETRGKPMATVSMTKGAELAGVSKGTVSKALKSGRLSYAEKTDNGYLIDTSERSEEHTSELQSLMRISYAVFCLKKKKNNTRTKHKDSIEHMTKTHNIKHKNSK